MQILIPESLAFLNNTNQTIRIAEAKNRLDISFHINSRHSKLLSARVVWSYGGNKIGKDF